MNELKIIYEDNHIIVADKPSGILTQGDYSGEQSLLNMLKEYIRLKYNKPGEAFIGLVHRLDRPVSGLLVFARTSKAAARLQKEFTSGRIEKYYIAAIENNAGLNDDWITLENNLLRERDITRVVKQESKQTEKGILHLYPLMQTKKYSLLLIKLDTGKKHQIRAQLSASGNPIIGDKKYGSVKDTGDAICLHSAYLSFTHPTLKTAMEFYSQPPEIFNGFVSYDDKALKSKVLSIIQASPFRQACQY